MPDQIKETRLRDSSEYPILTPLGWGSGSRLRTPQKQGVAHSTKGSVGTCMYEVWVGLRIEGCGLAVTRRSVLEGGDMYLIVCGSQSFNSSCAVDLRT